MDFNQAAMLLHVCDKANKWPNLKPLHDAAMAELMEMQKPKTEVKLTPRDIPAKAVERRE